MSQENSKTEKLRAAVKERVDKEEHAFRLVEKMVLLDFVDKEFLLSAGTYITISQYKDITEERAITKLCGYPLCKNRITQVLRQKYKISLKENKVYDVTERKNFCSNKCFKASKYFQSQLSSEPVWIRRNDKRLDLKVFDDDNPQIEKKLSGAGEEVFLDAREKLQELEDIDKEQEGVGDGHKDIHYSHKGEFKEHEHVGEEQEYFDYHHSEIGGEHDHANSQPEHFDDEQIHDELKHVFCEHENIDDSHDDMSAVTTRIGNVAIHLDIDLSDSDDDHDSIDDINSENTIDNNIENLVHERKMDNEKEKNSLKLQDESLRTAVNKETFSSISQAKVTENLKPNRNKSKRQTPNLCKVTNSSSCGEKLERRKQSVDKVYQVLLEWCSPETLEYTRNSMADKGKNRVAKQQSVVIPSIDSKSQTAMRGKIVSEKVNKAMSPLLSKLDLTMADISNQLTSMLKTFRFTSTNIVLKPAEWTIVSLVLILVLVKCSPLLNELLSPRQKDLHALLSDTLDDEDAMDRLLGVFNFQESAKLDGQQEFNMEELD